MKNAVVGIGEILWDILPTGKVPGGAPANFAYHVSQLGFTGCVVSAIGTDDLGKALVEFLNEKKIQSCIVNLDYPTGTVNVSVDNDGIPQYEIKENVAWDYIPFTSAFKELANSVAAVCFGSLAQRSSVSKQTIREFINSVSAESLKIFDINLRQSYFTSEIIIDSLMLCNILKINEDEIKIINELLNIKLCDELAVCKHLIAKYKLKMVILTKGVNGSYVITESLNLFRPTPAIIVKDTVGAGDAFTAAFVASLLKGESLEQAHEQAVQISAYVCTQSGAMPQLN